MAEADVRRVLRETIHRAIRLLKNQTIDHPHTSGLAWEALDILEAAILRPERGGSAMTDAPLSADVRRVLRARIEQIDKVLAEQFSVYGKDKREAFNSGAWVAISLEDLDCLRSDLEAAVLPLLDTPPTTHSTGYPDEAAVRYEIQDKISVAANAGANYQGRMARAQCEQFLVEMFMEERAALQSEVLAIRTQLEAVAREAFQLAGERSFILGNDIGETITRARAALVQRNKDLEAEVLALREQLEKGKV